MFAGMPACGPHPLLTSRRCPSHTYRLGLAIPGAGPSPGTARRLAVELAPGARGSQRREEVVVLPVLVAEAADGPHEVVRAAGQRAAAAERGGVGRRTAQHPRAVDAADELAPLGELAERRRHGRATRPDELAEDAVR